MKNLCIVGCGALGSTLLDRLRNLRFHGVLLVDPDLVEDRNLALSPFLQRAFQAEPRAHGTPEDPQKRGNKAHLLAEAGLRDGLRWSAFPCEIADVGWQDLQDIDLICCCADSTLARVETALIARALGKPMLDGAVLGNGIAEGRVAMFPAGIDAACYLCGLSEDRRAALLGYAGSSSLGCRLPEEVRAMTGTLRTLQQVADCMVQTILSASFEGASHAVRIQLDGDVRRDEPIALSRSAGCPWHGDWLLPAEPLAWEMPLEATLLAGKTELHLQWPVCTEAVCTVCKRRAQPRVRVAWVRRSMQCEHCGASAMEPLRSVHRVRGGDAMAALSPRQLGQPARHLYWLSGTGFEESASNDPL